MDNKQQISRRLNRLRRILMVQEEYQAKKVKGQPDAFVWREFIYPKFVISERSFRQYLETNAKKEIKELEAQCAP